ncbi:hypothetical protein HDC92_001674 [Pedobacter sp. AK017]|uniref:RagB/SusD family nutrient uptake outer membrane protein n=1 Tax=Pedobacter sp. AK017 TaxID=2723073 RepID=UPI001621CBFA|nr:RagB/SusD family nutrient uptake outer membrane protein [Pedobacter sp. AK017]MBB5437999.1 hypothetical protein [Pedobacter sp. AK017]
MKKILTNKNILMYSIYIHEATAHKTPQRFNKHNCFLCCMMILFFVLLNSCKKIVQVDTPPDSITEKNVYTNDRTAASVLTYIYVDMRSQGADMAKFTGLLGDEFTLWSGADFNLQAYYNNNLSSSMSMDTGKEIWNLYYKFVFTCNGAIEGLIASNSLSPNVKKQLLGEAYILRAWYYFYLVNLYGDLPLVVGTDPAINSKLHRSSRKAVYELIISDLLRAQELLNPAFVNGQLNPGTQERVRPTVWAAKAMLARVYLYTGEFDKAELAAGEVIANNTYFNLVGYEDIFLKNSREAIWQIQPTEVGWNSTDARLFNLSAIPTGVNAGKPVYFSDFLLAAFEPNDERRSQWVSSFTEGADTYYFPVKYKIAEENGTVNSPETLTEYAMMLRLGEQYLIRSEARARQNKLGLAISDLDMIRNRAKLPLIAVTNPSISQSDLLNTIFHERQVELFTEWGNRWFDLKRFGKVDEVMSVVTPVKGGGWENTDELLPIPYSDLVTDPNLTQNGGY